MTAPPAPASSNGLQFASLYALPSDTRAKKGAKFDASSAVLGREREGERDRERQRERESLFHLGETISAGVGSLPSIQSLGPS